MELDLTKGICETKDYTAWKFPGGEIHFIFKKDFIGSLATGPINIKTRINTSDDLMFLLLVADTIRKDFHFITMNLFIPYMPYQQADMNFNIGECFSLNTVSKLINSMKFDNVTVYHPHSSVTPALIDNCIVIDNTDFILKVIPKIYNEMKYIRERMILPGGLRITNYSLEQFYNELIIMSADAGGFKQVFKLCEKIGFNGRVESCSKSRCHKTNNITTKVPVIDSNAIVLIIDDISLASNTFLNIRKELKNEFVYLAVSHGVFNDNVYKLETEFKKVFTTNSRRDESIGQNIEVIPIF